MMKKKLFALMALIAVFALLCTACGSKAEDTKPAEEVLSLSDWNLTASTWSSPNGATVHLSATPAGYAEGQTANFIVRLEGEDVQNAPCEWDGNAYTASVDLNGEDGYCYYVALTSSKGETAEIAVNIPTDPFDSSLINMASSLESQCSVIVESSDFDGKWLSITKGSLTVQPPKIVNEGETITCKETALCLGLNGEEISRVAVEMPAAGADGNFTLDLKDIAFEIPELEDDQQLVLTMNVTLSNDQTLFAEGGVWFYNAGELLLSVG